MPNFLGLEVWSEKRCIAGAYRLAFVAELEKESDGCTDTTGVEIDESLSVKVPAPAAIAAGIAQGQILAEAFDDGSFLEWRVDTIAKTRTTWSITGKSILNDLVDAELVIDVDQSGFPSFAGGMANATPTEVLEAMLAHPRVLAAGIPSWLRIGQIDCTRVLEAVEWDTAGIVAISRATQTAIKASGEACELDIVPDPADPTHWYVINLVETIGAGAPIPTLVTGKNLIGDLSDMSARRDQFTAVIVSGGSLGGVNTGIGLSRWRIASITGAGPYVIALADLVAGGIGPIGADAQEVDGALYREADGALLEISGSSKSAQTVTLADKGDLAVDDIVQFRTTADPDTATPPVEVVHPARVALYGRKVGTFKRESVIGVPNLVPNAVMRTWTDPTLLPDGWAFSIDGGNNGLTTAPADYGGFITIAKNTDPLYWQIGGQSLQFSIAQGTLVTPPIRWTPMYAGQPFSFVFRLLLTRFSNPSSLIRLNLGIRMADGTVHRWWEDLRTLWCQPITGQRPASFRRLATGVWDSIGLTGNDITAASTVSAAFVRVTAADIAAIATGGADGFVVCMWAGGNGGNERIEGYVDAVMVNPGSATPEAITEFGGSNTLRQTANLVLNEVSEPVREITTSVHDLERLNAGTFSADALVKGGMARILDLPPTDNLLRMTQLARDRLVKARTQVTFASRRRLFTDLLVSSGGGVLLGTGSGSGTSSTGSTTTVTGTGSSNGPSIVLDGSITSDVPSVAATLSPGVLRVRIAGSTTPFADDAAATAAVDAETDITTFPVSKTFSAISVGETEYVAASAWDLNGVRSPLARTSIEDPFVDPGVETDLVPFFVDSMGDAGVNQSNGRWDFVNRDSSLVLRSTSGFNGGACLEEGAPGGFDDTYWQFTPIAFPAPRPNDLHVTRWFDLAGQSVAYEVPLIQAYPTLCALAMDATRHLKIYIDDGSGNPVLLGTSVSQLNASGGQRIEFRAHSHASAGFAWVRVNGVLVEFTPFGGGATVRGFTGLAFTNTSFTPNGILTSSIGIGTGTGFDYPWYPGPSGYDTTGGIVGVRWDDTGIYDNTGAATYDFAGNITIYSLFSTTSGLSSDDGDTSKDELTTIGETRSYALTALPVGATDILAVVPFYYHRGYRPSGFVSIATAYRWRVTSSSSFVTRYVDNIGGSSGASYTAFMELYSTNTYTGPNQTGEARWSVTVDPATSAKWLRAAVNALTLDLSVDALDTAGSATIRISQMGVEVACRA